MRPGPAGRLPAVKARFCARIGGDGSQCSLVVAESATCHAHDVSGFFHNGPMTDFFSRLSTYAANALRYWEPRRLIYNGALAAVVLAHFVLAWPASRGKLTLDLVLGYFILAVVANGAYCAVYVVDLFVQF